MISNLNPPWIYPQNGEIVKAMRPLRTSLTRVTYDFTNKAWIDAKGKPIQIYGWLRK
ncbi:hypothetical protein UFOVP816_17 [uncultured Caudovirales phage]|uniref:Uncharacterized protein n=1 Tax=uncultured Caudovirales phage TaxID=2100421 RepID=A0A6J5P4R4_9CAUD|nr:hypothetical protein UFOVP816_17 [uncultured Caudovirales phage]